MALELVIWRDSHFSFNEEPALKDYLVKTVGWVTTEGRWLRVVSEKAPKEQRGITWIVKENVIERHKLQRVS